MSLVKVKQAFAENNAGHMRALALKVRPQSPKKDKGSDGQVEFGAVEGARRRMH